MRAGLTQSQLAQRLSTTQSVVARWERATSDIGVERLQDILRACGYDLIPLVSIDDDGDRSLVNRFRKLQPDERAELHQNMSGQLAKLRGRVVRVVAPEFDEMMRILTKHGVRFIVIGGFAAVLAGSPFPTEDIDITPEASRENLARLSAALTELGAAVRVEGQEPLPFSHDADSLAAVNVLNLETNRGYLDIALVPSGTRGFADLDTSAYDAQIADVTVRVAALADVIRSKEAANRDKDHRVLPVLRDMLRRQARGE
jgi:transcriptional regulator with XRE-family HTH domain